MKDRLEKRTLDPAERAGIRKRSYRSIAFLLIFGLIVLAVESVLDYYAIYGVPALDLPFFQNPSPERLLLRLTVIVSFLAFGIYVSEIMTDLSTAERLANESEERYRGLYDNSMTGIYLISEGVFVSVNNGFAETLGYYPEEIIGKSARKFIHPEDREMFEAPEPTETNDLDADTKLKIRLISNEGEAVWVELLKRTIVYKGEPAEMGQTVDITRIKELENEKAKLAVELKSAKTALHYESTHDSLTGLWNRSTMVRRLKAEIARSTRSHRPVAAILMEIDHLRKINDSFGHSIGDEVVKASAARVSSVARPHDTVGRYGGAELLVVLPDTEKEVATGCAERIRYSISNNAVESKAGPISVTVSLGVAFIERPTSGDQVDSLIRSAGLALLHAVRRGGNRAIVIQTTD